MLYKIYDVELTLLEPMLGTVPKSTQIFTDYLAQRAEKRKDINTGEQVFVDQAAVLIDEETATVPDDPAENRGWTGFHTDAKGHFLYDYQIKGFIKESANLIKDFPGIKITNFRSKVDNYVYVFPRRIYLPEILDEPLERPLRAMTAQGPRVSLVRSDQIGEGVVIKFELRCLPHAEINPEILKSIFEFGEYKGLGQWRNGSYGRFSAEVKARV